MIHPILIENFAIHVADWSDAFLNPVVSREEVILFCIHPSISLTDLQVLSRPILRGANSYLAMRPVHQDISVYNASGAGEKRRLVLQYCSDAYLVGVFRMPAFQDVNSQRSCLTACSQLLSLVFVWKNQEVNRSFSVPLDTEIPVSNKKISPKMCRRFKRLVWLPAWCC